MVDKNLMGIDQVVEVNDTDMLYVVQNGTTDGRVDIGQVRNTVVKSLNGDVGDFVIKAGTNVTIDKTIVGEMTINADLPIIRTPEAISPLTGATDVSVTVTLEATSYANLYGVARLHRQFEVDVVGGDFSTPVASSNVDADTWMISPAILDNTEFKWRCRDVDIDGEMSDWSEEQSFTTYDIYISTPTITKPIEGGFVLDRDDPVEGSAYQPVNTVETHFASYWEIYNNVDVLVHSSGQDTVNLLSYTPPQGVLASGGNYSVRVRYEGSAGQISDWSVKVNFGVVGAGYGKYLAVSHAASPNALTIYGQDIDAFYKLTDPEQPEGGSGICSFSPDGVHFAVSKTTAPFLVIYKRTGDSFVILNTIDTPPTASISGLAFSPDGDHLVLSITAAPRIAIYRRNGDNYTKIANPSTLPTNYGRVFFSKDGQYVAISNVGTYVFWYKRAGDTFTNLTNISVAGQCSYVDFSSDSQYMAVLHENAPCLSVFKKGTGDTYTKLPDLTTRPSVTNSSLGYTMFSPDDLYLFSAGESGTRIVWHKRSGDTFTALTSPSIQPSAGGCLGGAMNETAEYIAVCYSSGSPTFIIYKRVGDTLTKLADPSVLPSAVGRPAIWPSAQYPTNQ